ncbi:hypothetical protein F5Y15DRAFT_370503 [Xylariaceae sp. FL0016]|nr:hypothetical protein F5Y15DRAFT_370503 [Xylariaceae sp. FL0016]
MPVFIVMARLFRMGVSAPPPELAAVSPGRADSSSQRQSALSKPASHYDIWKGTGSTSQGWDSPSSTYIPFLSLPNFCHITRPDKSHMALVSINRDKSRETLIFLGHD